MRQIRTSQKNPKDKLCSQQPSRGRKRENQDIRAGHGGQSRGKQEGGAFRDRARKPRGPEKPYLCSACIRQKKETNTPGTGRINGSSWQPRAFYTLSSVASKRSRQSLPTFLILSLLSTAFSSESQSVQALEAEPRGGLTQSPG